MQAQNARTKSPQSYIKKLLVSSENHPQNVPLPAPKMHYGAPFQPAIPETWQECVCTTLYGACRIREENGEVLDSCCISVRWAVM